LKLKCDEPLSNVGFKINLRRYIQGAAQHPGGAVAIAAAAHLGRAVQVDSINTRVEIAPGVCN
jgi:hypothetical protein